MATYPSDPNLSAATSTTSIDAAFLNTLIDNINAIGVALGDLQNNTADGNVDLAADKGIQWADTLKIYFSGGDIIIDDGVQISGTLDVATSLSVDTINDSGASSITFTENIALSSGKTADLETVNVDTIASSGALTITVSSSSGLKISTGSSGTLQLGAGSFSLYSDSTQSYINLIESTVMNNPVQNSAKLYMNASGDFMVKTNPTGSTKTATIMPYAPSAYTVTNDLTDRSYDADTVAIAELADVVGTIIADLQTLGLLG